MTTVSTPSAAAATVAVDGGPTLALPDDLLVLPEPAPLLEPEPVAQQRTVAELREALPGDRLRRLQQRRRLVREEILAVLFLVAALAITVGILAMQWLGAGGPAS
ncbi:MAG TPA: hypothetical protein VFH56_11330 [Acidimicrobiales bacterium]|nr:hypothetical protein [Acidimicrobiales bacterium]